jgi:hypothetical protein
MLPTGGCPDRRANCSSAGRIIQMGFNSGLQTPGLRYRGYYRRGSVGTGSLAGSGASLPFRDKGCASLVSGTLQARLFKDSDYGRLARENFAFGLMHFATAQKASGDVLPVAAVAFSSVTCLTLTGASWEARGAADP